MKKLINYYRSLKIKNKLSIILSTIILIVSILGLIALQISYNIYDDQLINESSEILNLYSTNIENELRKADNLSFNILSDTTIQNELKAINTDTASYERSDALGKLTQQLLKASQTENYITSISILDNTGTEYAVGRSTLLLSDERKEDIEDRAKRESGAVAWIEPADPDKCIVAARVIRSTGDMQKLATLVIRIDMGQLINAHFGIESRYKSNLIILSEDKTVFARDSSIGMDKIQLINNNQDYRVQNIGNRKFLIDYGTSTYTDWTYVSILPYEIIFQGITAMRSIMIFLYILIFFAALFTGLKFTAGITKPIVSLSKKMKIVEKGNFDIIDINTDFKENCDEIGQLDYDFSIMVNKINALINENYVKQLLIKETQLKALQSQINPHFLYNTLASINGLAKISKQNKISVMVKALGNLLRSSISNKEIIVTIDEELSLLSDYIAIQKIRYGDRLNFKMEVAEELRKCSIIKLTLQPIVENSINYALESKTGVCEITVKAYEFPDYIRISVTDNGPGMSEDFIARLQKDEIKPNGHGVGLKNIDERIKIMFGDQYGLNIESQLNEWTTVSINIPYNLR